MNALPSGTGWCRAITHCAAPAAESVHYVEGVSCPHCHDARSEEDRARFAERQRQIALAKKRGERHLGG